MWDLPGPGLEPVSPALTGGFLTTVPPGKPMAGGFLNTAPQGKSEAQVLYVSSQKEFSERQSDK